MATKSVNSQLIETMLKLSKLMKENMKFYSDFHELTFIQIQALIFLNYSKNVQMSEIASHFKIEMPTATSLINKLKTLKLVERHDDEKDRRLVRITLSKQGKNLLEKAMKERTIKINSMLSCLSDKDTAEFLRILQLITKHMEDKHE